ncbi:hypothetical protein Back11_12160 [Paenibacillus baekrokdamisoli]|uniref:Uncharacterized protein n=1 Tax=Paenibacillus baekrokdamisoli TaxID=1712516 RepID=A0A3G9J203_9BACL|nr:hypothetical protein [Paenibacillus baekrokdamisoli]MBB3070521.1 hypothetical protein [Paenibacillus baekrokdamisoli]BBH19871.1 hypothetical protein Back11_12160 [Paenibacillus baekrokdamisoli]
MYSSNFTATSDIVNKRVTFAYAGTLNSGLSIVKTGSVSWLGGINFNLVDSGTVQNLPISATINITPASSVFLSADKVLCLFLGTIGGVAQSAVVLLTPETALSYAGAAYDMAVGIATGDAKVALKGIVTIAAGGLMAGAQYYYDSNGVITLVATGNTSLGKAVSTTEIVLKDYIF